MTLENADLPVWQSNEPDGLDENLASNAIVGAEYSVAYTNIPFQRGTASDQWCILAYGSSNAEDNALALVSTTLLFAVCLVSVCARYYIRVAVQKEFSLDDGFLAFGTACLIAAMAVLYINMDDMYFTEALTYPPASFASASHPPDLNRVFEFRKLVTASLILTWVAMMAVKFSFLALFRRLIDRIAPLIRYWYVVVAFNIAVTGYGASVYVIACPHFSGPKVVSCLGGATRHKTIQYAVSQLVLDVFGDLLILYIPVQLIWRVKIKPIQKLTLACSLCLTVFVIIFTVTRASGLEWQGKLDVLWEVYFQIVAAEVGLILVSMTAFRALFVSRAARNQHSPQKDPSLWAKSRLALKRFLDPRQWMSNNSKNPSGGQKHGTPKEDFDGGLPSVPGATMTGMRTFIDHQGDTTKVDNELSTSATTTEEIQDDWPLSKRGSILHTHEQNPSLDQSMPETSPDTENMPPTSMHCGQPTHSDTV